MTVELASTVVTPGGLLSPGAVEVEDGRIVAVEPTSGTVPYRILAPGLVDLQVNGIDDIDVATAEGDDWDRLDELLVAQGVTAWCPTLVTGPPDGYAKPLARIAEAAERPGARPLIIGAHLEGPFLGSRHGAHPHDLVIPADLEWLAALPEIVCLVTLGAEDAATGDAIRSLVDQGVVVSIGHTGADLAQAHDAIDAGARLVTHGYNAMSALDHRAPGMVGAFLTDDRVTVSLIADLVHVHPVALDIAFRCKPADRVVLVSDAVAWRGRRVGAIDIEHDGTVPRLADGTLAGSSLVLDEAIANVVHHCGVPLERAVASASSVPAALLDLDDCGAIEVGRSADLVALDPGSLRCTTTWIAGQQVHG